MKYLINKPAEFYDNISGFYDKMISFESSLDNRKQVIRNLVKRGMKTACDLGCGTGLDTISLALAGLNVTAFDISGKMIEQAAKNSLRMGVNVNFEVGPIHKIDLKYSNKFDMAVSLGNTMANISPRELTGCFKKIHKMLKQKGILVIQLLNYELIRKSNKRIIKISNGNEETIIRFYDILPEKFNFNILKFNNADPSKYALNTAVIYPYNRQSIKAMLQKAGFGKIKFSGSLGLENFVSNKSGDLVITASG